MERLKPIRNNPQKDTTMHTTIISPGKLTIASGGWLKFNDTYDEELAEYEGYIYHLEDTGQFYTGTYHQDVGLVTYTGPFALENDAEQFLYNNGFENYSG